MPDIREIKESPLEQGAEEEIVYTLTTTPWGSSPGSTVVTVFDTTEGARTDVTSTVMPVNSPTEEGDVITLSPLKSLTAGNTYRVEIKFTISGNIFEAYSIIRCKN